MQYVLTLFKKIIVYTLQLKNITLNHDPINISVSFLDQGGEMTAIGVPAFNTLVTIRLHPST